MLNMAVCSNMCLCCLYPVLIRDPWIPDRGGVSRGGAAGSAQGPDGEPDIRIQPGTRGVKPATTFSQHRRSLQSVGPGPGWVASEGGGDNRKISLFAIPSAMMCFCFLVNLFICLLFFSFRL